jgi:hypothetical protein
LRYIDIDKRINRNFIAIYSISSFVLIQTTQIAGFLRVLVLGLALLAICFGNSFAQFSVPNVNQNVEEEAEEQLEYTSETSYGINFNTNAGLIGGGMFKYVTITPDKKWYQGFEIELAHVKNPKEERVTNQVTNNSFLLFKQNYLIALRPSYVRELILFRKAPEEGIHLNAMVAVGPSFGLLKPYYVLYSPTNDVETAQSVPYDPAIHRNSTDNIYGTGNFFDGFDKIKTVLGAHLKLALNFEFGPIKSNVVGVQAGFVAEKFSKEMPIMDVAPNRSYFTSAFVTFYYGNKK